MFRENLRSLHLMERQFPSCFCPIHTIEFLDCLPLFPRDVTLSSATAAEQAGDLRDG